ncbi:MAG: transporter substrate-binding domain-containing protein, partial [Schwartzia sp.]|nr:transporter substrate-binding domain-containing protein [Schwartzia sp. (in: firmicutes)]
MRKKRLLFSIVLFLGLFLSFAASATSVSDIDRSRPILRVGYSDVPGYISKDEDGYFHGFIYDYLEGIAVYCGYQFEYVEARPMECIEKMLRGELDLAAALPDVKNPGFGLMAAQHAITYSPVGLIAHPGQTLDRGLQLRIGYISFIYSEQKISDALQSYGLTEGDDYVLFPFDDPLTMIENYRKRALDAYIDATLYHQSGDPMLARLFTQRFSIVMPRNHEALCEKIDRAVEELMLLNPHIRGQLYAKHANRAAPLFLTPDEKEYLAKHPVISAIATPGQKPYTYFENGEPKGVIAEIMHLIEKDLGIRFEFRETKNNSEVMPLLTSGEVEVVTNYYSDANWGHLHNAVLTLPYLTMNYVPVMRINHDIPEKPIIACAQNHFHTHAHIEKNYPK